MWDEREAGMRRWTDGKSWSASRVSGSFLTYREMEGKRGGGSNAFAPPVTTPAGRSPNPDSDSDGMEAEGPDGYRYKADGLMKQSFSITTATHQKLHLISYYARAAAHCHQILPQPTQDPALKHIRPVKGMYPESTVHEQQNLPVASRAPMISSMPQQSAPAPSYPPRQNSNYGHAMHSQQQQNPWPPSPAATPPTNMPHASIYGQHALPPPTQSAGSHMSYSPYAQQTPNSNGGSPRMYDMPQLNGRLPQACTMHQQSSMGSPLVHHQSPRGASSQPPHRSSPPLALPAPHMQNSQYNNHDRYTSPANSTRSRSPPRHDRNTIPPEYNIRPLRNSPSAQDSEANLDVQDIPSEKFRFREEDRRAISMLDKAFAL